MNTALDILFTVAHSRAAQLVAWLAGLAATALAGWLVVGDAEQAEFATKLAADLGQVLLTVVLAVIAWSRGKFVKGYQKRRGLDVDGYAGPVTGDDFETTVPHAHTRRR